MAVTKDVVVLDIREVTGGLCNVRFAVWLQITAPYPSPNQVSAYLDINNDATVGASGQNIPAALTAGTVVEEVYSILVPNQLIGSSWGTIIEPYIAAIVTARKNYHAGTGAAAPDPGLKYKILHDQSTGWSA